MSKSFSGQVVLITGAAGGLGGALAMQFARNGARLLLLDKDSPGLDHVSDEIVNEGLAQPGLCPLDLATAGPDAFRELVTLLDAEFGGLNHLLHCAADFNGLSPLEQTAPSDWLQCLQVNLNAAWLLTVSCLPLLRLSERQASVTFILEDEKKTQGAYWGAYGLGKSALGSMAHMLRDELENSSIRVLGINPGPMRTGLRARAYMAENPESMPTPAGPARKIIRQIKRACS